MLSNKSEVTVFGRIFSGENLHREYATQPQSAAEQILFWKHSKSSQKPVWFVVLNLKFHN